MEVATEKPATNTVPEGYKRTDIGLLPNDWKLATIGSFASVRGRVGWRGYTKDDIQEHGPLAIGAKHINKENQLDLTETTHISREKYLESPEIIIEEKDLLLVQRGTIGKLTIIDRKVGEATINPSMVIVRISKYLPKYIYYQLSSEVGQNQILKDTTSTGVPMISQAQIGNFAVHLPPTLEEQRAIAGALSDVDALIAELDALIDKKQQVKKGAMQQLLTPNGSGQAGKKRLPGFEGEWEEEKLGDICQIINGGTPSTKNPKYWDGQIPWCTPTDITSTKNRSIAKTERNITKAGLNQSSATLLPKGSLLLCSRATIGEIKIAACEIATNQGFKSLVCSEDINNEFFYYLIFLQKQKFIDKAFGSTFLEISKKNTQEIEFNFPNLNEQKAIAQILSDMDAEIQALQAKRSKYKKIKQGMMQELLIGKTRLVSKSENQSGSTDEEQSGHNWQIDEAVLISVLSGRFGSKEYPLGRFRRTKFSYLVRRFLESKVDQFLKKAAGPYNHNTRYSGPERIALDNGYVQEWKNGKRIGFIADENILKAQEYFEGWYGFDTLDWLDNGFRYKKNEDLELLTTVDKSIVELKEEGKEVSLEDVKHIIASHPKWEEKLERDLFSDENIEEAIKDSLELFK